MKPNTIPKSAGPTKKCCLCEKQFGKEVVVAKRSNPIRDNDFGITVVKTHCQLTGCFRGVAHTESILKTRKVLFIHTNTLPKTFWKSLLVNF